MTEGGRPGEGDPAAFPRQEFSLETVTALRHRVAAHLAGLGLDDITAENFVMAVHELITNAVRHGGGRGVLEMRLVADTLVGEVVDHGGEPHGLPLHMPPPDVPGGRGLWLAHHLTQGLVLTRRPDGVTASVSVCLTGTPAPASTPSTYPDS
jgi:serine/threonine-protein kinase RsbW